MDPLGRKTWGRAASYQFSQMNERLKQRLMVLMGRSRATLESAQGILKYIELKKEIEERTSQNEAIIKKLDTHLTAIGEAMTRIFSWMIYMKTLP
jgi:hypothetical protein